MRFSSAAIVAIALLVPATSADAAKKLPRVPEGFTIEVVASSPLVKHPMMAGFDDRGRLFIAESAGKNIRSGDLVKNPPNFIRMIVDTNGDGVFDRSTIFADKMTLPMGALWHRGALYVASPPNIWRLRDFDDDGVADERTILVDTFGFSGNAASVHGCFLGPNGRLYWCDGRHGHEFTDKDGKVTSKGKAARIFSCRLDGSDVECWAGGGMDNPVEVDFMPLGEMVGSINIFRGRPRADTLVHWMDGGAYPRFDQACVAEFPKTGKLLPAMTNFGHVAVSGMTRYRSREFGSEFRYNIFTTLFNTHRVVRSRVELSGATFRTREEEFLVSDDPDFHPTDVLEDADGSLLVIDTGGWFRIGCPVSKVAKPEIHGAIYRIRRKGAHRVKDPRGRFLDKARFTPEALAFFLDDPRPAVRSRVIDRLAREGQAALPALEAIVRRKSGKRASLDSRINAVWALSRIDRAGSRKLLRLALADPVMGVRVAAARSLGTLGDPEAVEPLLSLLGPDQSPPVRRQAATALGRIARADRGVLEAGRQRPVIASLLRSVRRGGVDRFEEHALLYAAIRADDRAATLPLLADASPRVRRAALIVLDQMPSGRLDRGLVVPLLDTDDPPLQQAVLEVIGRHKGWASQTRGLLETWLKEPKIAAERQAVIRGFLLSQQDDVQIQDLVGARLADDSLGTPARRLLLEVIGRSSLGSLPEPWTTALTSALGHADLAVRESAVRTLAARRKVVSGLAKLADDVRQPAGLRVAALEGLVETPLSEGRFAFLQGRLDADHPPLARLAAARVLGAAPLKPPQLHVVAARLATAGPLELKVLLRACGDGVQDIGLARTVLAGLEASNSLDSIPADQLDAVLGRMPRGVRKRVARLLRRVAGELRRRRAELARRIKGLAGGDIARGRAVFFGKKAACSGCHAVAAKGGRVGPDLTTIGDIRQPQDLLESIVLPSATFARGYRSYTVATQAGKVHSGVIARETTSAIWLKTAELAEIRVARSQIEVIKESDTSIMPKGLDKTLSPGELGDLLAFLVSCRKAAGKVTTTP